MHYQTLPHGQFARSLDLWLCSYESVVTRANTLWACHSSITFHVFTCLWFVLTRTRKKGACSGAFMQINGKSSIASLQTATGLGIPSRRLTCSRPVSRRKAVNSSTASG